MCTYYYDAETAYVNEPYPEEEKRTTVRLIDDIEIEEDVADVIRERFRQP